MTFSPTPPTKPGFYALRQRGGITVIHLEPNCIQLQEPNAIIGEWCLLLPADSIEEAFREGLQSRLPPDILLPKTDEDQLWLTSNARKKLL